MTALPRPVSSRGALADALRAKFSPDAASLAPLVVLLLVAHVLLWTVLSGVSHRAPDLDNMEELVWGNVFEWGYYKHPPLPSWIIFGLTSLFGREVWVTFFAGQLSVALSLWFVWKIGCEMTSQSNALVATLLIAPITYYTTRGLISNHNTLQLWSMAATLWMFYRSWRYGRARDWLGLGIFAGLALLSKYSAVVQFAVFFLFLLADGKLAQARVWKGIGIALLPLAAIMAPHLLWLRQAVMTPIGYASESIGRDSTRLENLQLLGDMVSTTVARLAPMALALLLIVWLYRRAAPGSQREPRLSDGLRAEDRKFILLAGLGPLVLTLAVVLVFKAPLIADWTTTYYMLFGFFAFWLLREEAGEHPGANPGQGQTLLHTCLRVIILVQVVTAVGYALARGPVADRIGRPSRANFPGREISEQMQQRWEEHVDAPLTLVAADTWLGGNIAIHAGRQVNVLIDGDVEKSQWTSAAQAQNCGMLLAINRTPGQTDGIADKVVQLMHRASWRGTLLLPATRKLDGPKIMIEWGVIAPTAECRR